MKVLLVHGVGSGFTEEAWTELLAAGDFDPATTDQFDYATVLDDAGWFVRLASKLIWPIAAAFRQTSRVDEVGDVQTWLVSPGVRSKIAGVLRGVILTGGYDVIVAHSLGTLMTWEAISCDVRFRRNARPYKDPIVIFCGSPLGLGTVRAFLQYKKNEPTFAALGSEVISGIRDPIGKFGKDKWEPEGWTRTYVPIGHSFTSYLRYVSKSLRPY